MTQETVLITGANRGIGLALTETYLKDDAKVIATCRAPHKSKELHTLQKKYPDLALETLDVTDNTSRKALAEKLKNTPIDILINNAGILSGTEDSACVKDKDVSQTLGTLDEKAWMKVLRTNSIAPIMLTQELFTNLEIGQSKKIVMISSGLGSIALASDIDCNRMAYNSSKTILNAATKSIALHLQTKNYIVTTFSPGWVQTRMGSDQADLSPQESSQMLKKCITKLTPKDSGSFLDLNGKVKPW